MFCEKCGGKNDDGTIFCNTCGAAVNDQTQEPAGMQYQSPVMENNQQPVYSQPQFMGDMQQTPQNMQPQYPVDMQYQTPQQQPLQEQYPVDIQQPLQQQYHLPGNQFLPPDERLQRQQPGNRKTKNNKTAIIVVAVVLVLVATVGALFLFTDIFNKTEEPLTIWEILDLGEKHLRDLEYELALEQFLKAVEIDPMNPRGYTGAAEAYIGLGRENDAVAILELGLSRIGNSPSIQRMLDDVNEAINTGDWYLFTPGQGDDSGTIDGPGTGNATGPGTATPPDIDWKTEYRNFIDRFYTENIATREVDEWDFSGGFRISLLDLNFDGIPELIIDTSGHWSEHREVFYVTNSGVLPAQRTGFEHDENIGPLHLLRDRATDDLQYVAMHDIYLDWWGAFPGFLREISMDNGMLNITQMLSIELDEDIRHDRAYNIYQESLYENGNERPTEAQVLQGNLTWFTAFSYDNQGRQSAISPIEYLNRKNDFMNRFDILETHYWNFPASMNYEYSWEAGTPYTDITVDELFALWERTR